MEIKPLITITKMDIVMRLIASVLIGLLLLTQLLPRERKTDAASIKFSVPQSVITILDGYLNEPGGLVDELNDSSFLLDNTNTVKRVSLGGLSLLEEQQAEKDAFTYIIAHNGQTVNCVNIQPAWKSMLIGLLDSYITAGGGTTSYSVTFPGYRTLTVTEQQLQSAYNFIKTACP